MAEQRSGGGHFLLWVVLFLVGQEACDVKKNLSATEFRLKSDIQRLEQRLRAVENPVDPEAPSTVKRDTPPVGGAR